MTTGEIDDVIIARVDFVGPSGRGEQRHPLLFVKPGFGGCIQKRPFERTRFERRWAALRAYEPLLVVLRLKHVVGVRQFRQPKPRRVARIVVVGDIADDMENAGAHCQVSELSRMRELRLDHCVGTITLERSLGSSAPASRVARCPLWVVG